MVHGCGWRADRGGVNGHGNPVGQLRLTISVFLVQENKLLDGGPWCCMVGFLVPDLACPHLYTGGELLVLEGPRVVSAWIETVLAQG